MTSNPTAQRVEAGERTSSRILDIGERLVQLRGFNGFSYADIATELGISKPSLHYHFASKAELGEALITRYSERFAAALAAIDGSGAGPRGRLERYAELYAQVLDADRMCLCGMLAAEYDTLPDGMRSAVIRFFDANERWLAEVLGQGAALGEFEFDGSPADEAKLLLGALEGAMLVARAYRQPARLRLTSQRLIAALSA
jgi:TetR/AcrR family transcriptional regulator, transcriptional repressor for nem operon